MAEYAGHRPFGDIYTIPTQERAVNAIAEKIYREKQLADLQKRQEVKALDDEFGKNLANVKSIDIPRIVEKYNKYKQAKINLNKKGDKATPDDQMAAMIAQADVGNSIGASREDKERIKNRIIEIKGDKKGKYKLDAHKTAAQLLNTETDKRNPDADDDLFYNQYSFPDLEKVSANMIGLPKEIKIPTGKPSAKGDLYDDELVLQRFNHPNQMYNNAFLDVSKRNDKDHYERVISDSLSDEEKQALKERYFAKVSSPEFKAIYGEVQPFPESAEKTELGQAVALSVMSAVDKLPIQPLRTENKLNSERAKAKDRKEDMEDWLAKNKLTYQQSLNKIAANKQNGVSGSEDLGYVTDEYFANHGKSLTPDEEKFVTSIAGVTPKGYVEVSNIHPSDLPIIAGDRTKKEIRVEPVDLNGKMVYFVDADGNWIGKNGKIDREAVRRKRIETKDNTKIKIQQLSNKKPFNNAPAKKGDFDDIK